MAGRRWIAPALICGLAVALITIAPPSLARAEQIDLATLPAFKTPKAAQSLILALAAVGDRLVAVGERGIIVHSDDNGSTWIQADVPVSVTLTAVTFPTPTEGWAVGHDGMILHSTDRGETWQVQFDGTRAAAAVRQDAERRVALARARADAASPQDEAALAALDLAETALDDAMAGVRFAPSRPFLAVAFQDARFGLAVGSFGQIFRTTNGGASWVYLGDRIDNQERLHYGAVMIDPSGRIVVAGEGGRITRSADRGEHWTVTALPERGAIAGLRRVGPALLAYGGGGRVYRSVDDGTSWTRIVTCTGKTLIAGLVQADSVRLYDSGGAALVSDDGGLRWTCPAAPDSSPRPVAAVAATADGKLVLAGPGGLRISDIVTAR
ncbi:Uncharacterized protein SAMN04244559_00949 [Magnetospirillum fulvum]|uniref:Photosynthesis system II assembly factor Ycf48/Hcf136-like domain-containing protein n=2 Tax=Magnetospirillum fulvum TaxID=1082 RepID=A0A1H6H477_MAGFU|nr:Uncharacterized protein SAMN04244559_00949 [Magnetospirillum fulvum]